MTSNQPNGQVASAKDDLRHLIVMDTQLQWSGQTTLKLPEIERLVARGWVREGDDNCEFDVTESGHEAIISALSAPPAEVEAALAVARDNAQASRQAIKLLVAAGFVTEATANEAQSIAHGFERGPLAPAGGEAVGNEGFKAWLVEQMPAGTVIGAFTDEPIHDSHSNYADAFRQWAQGFDAKTVSESDVRRLGETHEGIVLAAMLHDNVRAGDFIRALTAAVNAVLAAAAKGVGK